MILRRAEYTTTPLYQNVLVAAFLPLLPLPHSSVLAHEAQVVTGDNCVLMSPVFVGPICHM